MFNKYFLLPLPACDNIQFRCAKYWLVMWILVNRTKHVNDKVSLDVSEKSFKSDLDE